MVYWSEGDTEPIYMEWELQNTNPLPDPPFGELIAWAKQYLDTDVRHTPRRGLQYPAAPARCSWWGRRSRVGARARPVHAQRPIRHSRSAGPACPAGHAATEHGGDGCASWPSGSEVQAGDRGLLLAARHNAITSGGRPPAAGGCDRLGAPSPARPAPPASTCGPSCCPAALRAAGMVRLTWERCFAASFGRSRHVAQPPAVAALPPRTQRGLWLRVPGQNGRHPHSHRGVESDSLI